MKTILSVCVCACICMVVWMYAEAHDWCLESSRIVLTHPCIVEANYFYLTKSRLVLLTCLGSLALDPVSTSRRLELWVGDPHVYVGVQFSVVWLVLEPLSGLHSPTTIFIFTV